MVSKRRITALTMGVLGGAALLLGQVNMAAAQTTSTGGVVVTGTIVCITPLTVSVMGDQSAYNILVPPPASTTTISVGADQSAYNIFVPPPASTTTISVGADQSAYNILVPSPASTTTISVGADQTAYNVIGDIPFC